MAARERFQISLARKCQLLFGLSVLLIIAAALLIPGRYMERLVQELNLREARNLALIARAWADPMSGDWQVQQELLDKWWQDNAGVLRLPEAKPRLIAAPFSAHLLSTPSAVSAYDQLAAHWEDVDRGWQWLEQRSLTPDSWQLVRAVWQSLPQSARERAGRQVPQSAERLGRAWLSAQADRGSLDPYLLQCIVEMTNNESIPHKHRALRGAGEPTVYEFVLPVRSVEAGPHRRPLVGIIDVRLPTRETSEIFWVRLILILAGTLAGFLAILVFYIVTQKLILAPVRGLKVLVERIAGGDLTARSDIQTADEFEELAVAFNQMLGELEASQRQLEITNRSLDTRLGELAQTNVALYESNRLKSEFLANVSHELRTPLTSIIGFADLLRDHAQAGNQIEVSRVARFAANILTSGRMLLDIINDLLDLAKIEAGKVELHRSRFSLRDVCEGLADFVRPLVDQKSQEFEIEIGEDLPAMHSDPGKLRQILFNLLSNAVKYTPDGGTIRLQAAGLNGNELVRVEVSDTGPGIAPEHQEQIFEKFHQLDASMTREHSGTGLGLPISRELTIMLGGTIRVDSQPGRGARFIVELPVECPETAQRPLPALT